MDPVRRILLEEHVRSDSVDLEALAERQLLDVAVLRQYAIGMTNAGLLSLDEGKFNITDKGRELALEMEKAEADLVRGTTPTWQPRG